MAKSIGIKIVTVTQGGLAESANVSAGDTLLEVNGETVLDSLNYQFLVSQRDSTKILVKKSDGSLVKKVLKNDGNALGLELAQDKIEVCRSNCTFCFVRQMPPGFRKSLYVKDEDIRLSFLYGNFTTLSNSGPRELDRIIREGLSPIHVSVHATDPSVRARLLGSPRHGDILGKIDRLIDGGIKIHTQAVIVPGCNDGDAWRRTVQDLWERRVRFEPKSNKGGILTLSCIPVGLTDHRQGLPYIQEISPSYAMDWACSWKAVAQRYARERGGCPWLLLADEWFAKAGMALPGRQFYPSDWAQIENGIGLIRRFQDHSSRFIKSNRANGFSGLRLALLTGMSFAPYLSRMIENLNSNVGSMLRVISVPNGAFGAQVTVAGLLCGQDLLRAAEKDRLCEVGNETNAYVVPSASIRDVDGGQFLDDMTVTEMQSKLGLPVIPGGNNLSELLSNVRASARRL